MAPYGGWRSPIAPADLAVAGVRLSEVRVDGDDLYWIERRPTEGGRNALVRRQSSGHTGDVLTMAWSARTTAHEYGGGSFAVRDGVVVFANDDDQRLYDIQPGRHPLPVTKAPKPTRSVRFADITIHPSGAFAVAVREVHAGRHVTNDLVAVALTGRGRGDVTELASGHDFYSSPRISPAGDRMAWLTWDQPQMPWDGTELWVADVDTERDPPAALSATRLVAGSADESVVQPEWDVDGTLYFASDRTGWWNLYVTDDAKGETRPVTTGDVEFAGPQWVFGLSWFTFLADGRIAAAFTAAGTWRLAVVEPATGRLDEVPTPYTDISYVAALGNDVVYVGGSPVEPQVVARTDVSIRRTAAIRSTQAPPDPGVVSVPEPIDFATSGGATAHAFFYRPANRDYAAPDGELPPLIVIGHGGPTSATRTAYNAAIQFWTTRGVAVVDVNYRGSTGYGRAYRDALKGRWGLADVDDCIAAARHLVTTGQVDGKRLAIRGGSAGGYTVLRALTATKDFAAAASHYGVADLEVLARDTHKFEARYLDGLVGPYPERRDIYVERSPIHHAERITAPLIVLQGLDDAVVPPGQSEMIVEALRQKGVPVAYLEFEGEGHGFRRADSVIRAAEAELAFFGRMLGFAPADELPPVAIHNLS